MDSAVSYSGSTVPSSIIVPCIPLSAPLSLISRTAMTALAPLVTLSVTFFSASRLLYSSLILRMALLRSASCFSSSASSLLAANIFSVNVLTSETGPASSFALLMLHSQSFISKPTPLTCSSRDARDRDASSSAVCAVAASMLALCSADPFSSMAFSTLTNLSWSSVCSPPLLLISPLMRAASALASFSSPLFSLRAISLSSISRMQDPMLFSASASICLDMLRDLSCSSLSSAALSMRSAKVAMAIFTDSILSFRVRYSGPTWASISASLSFISVSRSDILFLSSSLLSLSSDISLS